MAFWATLRHIRRLADVEERLRELEAQMKALDREWSDAHDYLQRMLGKIAKRAKQLEKGEKIEQETAEANGAADPETAAGPAKFGSKTATILRQIAARRGG